MTMSNHRSLHSHVLGVHNWTEAMMVNHRALHSHIICVHDWSEPMMVTIELWTVTYWVYMTGRITVKELWTVTYWVYMTRPIMVNNRALYSLVLGVHDWTSNGKP